MESVATRLREIRQTRGISQYALAKAAGISAAAVNRIEAGLNAPRLDTAAALASVLGVSVTELVGGSESQSPRELHTVLDELDEGNVARAADYLEYLLRRQRADQAMVRITTKEDSIARTRRIRRQLGQGVITLVAIAAAGAATLHGDHIAAAAAVPGLLHGIDITSPEQGGEEAVDQAA